MPDLYRAADVLLHMSQDEPFGNVYVEALATGLPIVAHSTLVTQWILEDQAILVDTCDRANVVVALRQALADAHRKTPPHADCLPSGGFRGTRSRPNTAIFSMLRACGETASPRSASVCKVLSKHRYSAKAIDQFGSSGPPSARYLAVLSTL